ncbi:MAG: hypothetical protein KDH16_04405, partial [Rhodocyclaceae bacterium]|nr:hypothetical protein [Rhodocyclaceae bacterium]
MNEVLTLAVTTGEPAGVGPELCAALIDRTWPVRLVLVGDRDLIETRLRAAAAPQVLPDYVAGGEAI